MKSVNTHEFAAVIGIDWADAKHDFCLLASDSGQLEFGQFPHTVEDIAAWVEKLRERFKNQPIAIAIELAKGPLVYALQRHAFLVLFPINPASLAKFRQTFSPSHAKDDPSDAFLLLDLFRRHRDRFSALQLDSPAMRSLQQMVETRVTVRADIVRVTNRLTSALKNYFPQALEWFNKKDTRIFCDFLQRWPTPDQARKARKRTLERFFHAHSVRYTQRIEQRIAAIKALTPLTTDPGVLEPAVLLVDALVRQLQVLIETRARYDAAIARVAKELDEYRIFSSFPGAAAVYAPRLMAAFGEQRDRFSSASHAQRAFAIAPVIERSGQKSWVHWRFRCDKMLRQTLVEWSALSIPHSFWAKAYYQQQRDKGSSHQAALRALAFKWTRILFRCWKDRVEYDENAYLEALRNRRSPLLKYIAETA